MKSILIPLALAVCLFAACQGGSTSSDNITSGTPIDSTNLNGTAPAVYGADNPANDQDTTYRNSSDTGTRISNGPDNTNNTQNR